MSNMDPRERTLLIQSVKDDLSNVIGASGKPDELVRLTTSIVQGSKKLVIGVPDDLSTKGTGALTEFVIAARLIAKNPRAVDAKAVQDLSTTRRRVEEIVNQLEAWHTSFVPIQEDEALLDEFGDRKGSPETAPPSQQEMKLCKELQRLQKQLMSKMEPQKTPPEQGGKVEDALVMSQKGVTRGTEEMMKIIEGRAPTRQQLLDPIVLVTKMVSGLLDIVDGLFVSKYPMRSQVYSFSTSLIEAILSFGTKSKIEDASIARTISTQAPSLCHAVEVMVEQCLKRCSTLEESRDFSIKRNNELGERKKIRLKPPPEPPKPVPKKPVVEEFEITCIVCTNVAVDQKTQQPISRGSDLTLVITENTKIKAIKQDLSSRTGLPLENIKFQQGNEEISDTATLTPNSPLPYFLFNNFEPTEAELREIRKDQRRQNRLTIHNIDWSQVSGIVAVALYEYDTLGDETSLAFDEGDIVEITEKSADGWWDGRIGDKTGSFPASFVEEISSKEEGLRLMKLMKRGEQTSSPDQKPGVQRHLSSSSEAASPSSPATSSPRFLRGVKNPLKLNRGISSPDIERSASPQSNGSKSPKKKTSFLKKNKKKFSSFDEEEEEEEEKGEVWATSSPAAVKKALIPPKRSKPARPPPPPPAPYKEPKVFGEEQQEKPTSPLPPTKELPEQVAPAPKMNYKRGADVVPKKRPPPPRPAPFASTHPVQASKLTAIIQATKKEEDKEEEEPSKVVSPNNDEAGKLEPPKPSTSPSMEELFKNLEDFGTNDSPPISASKRDSEVDIYEIVSPSPPPPRSASADSQDDKVITIKISDYKPDTDDDLDDDEEEEEVLPGNDNRNIQRGSIDNSNGWSGGTYPLKQQVVNDGNHRPSSTIPVLTHNRTDDSNKLPRSEGSSPNLVIPAKSTESTLSSSPPRPLAPPRQKRGNVSPQVRRPAPKAPPKPKVLVTARRTTSSSSMGPNKPVPAPPSQRSSTEQSDGPPGPGIIRGRRWTMAAGRKHLLGTPVAPPPRSRSPLVQRRTRIAIGPKSPPLLANGKKQSYLECTGLGKEGVLFKESSKPTGPMWKSRYFKLLDDGLIYFSTDGGSDKKPDEGNPIGELSASRMHKALYIGEREGLMCFSVLIRYDSSVMLGCYSLVELEDWVKSINLVIDMNRMKEKLPSYQPAHSAAVAALNYLIHVPDILDKSVLKHSGGLDMVECWLDEIDGGEMPDISAFPNGSVAFSLLEELFTLERIGPVISSDIAVDLSQQVKKSCPIEETRSKLHHSHDDSLQLLRLFLDMFKKILSTSSGRYQMEISDLNRIFGSALFDGIKMNQSLTLLVYLINNQQDIFL